MDHISVFDMFSPIHVAYLKRCAAEGLEVVPADLDSIERNHPAAAQDPLLLIIAVTLSCPWAGSRF